MNCGTGSQGQKGSAMYQVSHYNGTEWVTVFQSMDWGKANAEKCRLVKIHGWHYVEMVYASIV